ncbi:MULTISPECIES: hypothetical protein [Mesorhizobium]|uniref:DUF4148 domain-containing protein n=1 Tax=Mesorhizobium denitrificans TaxID=2294114 RepID=A0A371X8U1_9HYPH|nr:MULTISPECIES: hypothetical protein [Mesorhizobium]RFC65620.1 hypothetical protein DY251_17740 [Mesorhizobium denitrificans]
MTGPWKSIASNGARAAVIVAMLATAACTTTPDDPSSGASNTGTYPNLNVKPAIATSQISQEERDAAVASLKGASAAQAAAGKGAGTTASEAQLRQLGATHSDETLKEICAPRPTC